VNTEAKVLFGRLASGVPIMARAERNYPPGHNQACESAVAFDLVRLELTVGYRQFEVHAITRPSGPARFFIAGDVETFLYAEAEALQLAKAARVDVERHLVVTLTDPDGTRTYASIGEFADYFVGKVREAILSEDWGDLGGVKEVILTGDWGVPDSDLRNRVGTMRLLDRNRRHAVNVSLKDFLDFLFAQAREQLREEGFVRQADIDAREERRREVARIGGRNLIQVVR